jgi:hypothetical protein
VAIVVAVDVERFRKYVPVMMSTMATPTFMGCPCGSPVMDISPDMPCLAAEGDLQMADAAMVKGGGERACRRKS